MDYGKLAQVKIADSATDAAKEEKRKKIQDAIERRRAAREKARKIADAKRRREEKNQKVEDSKEYSKFKVTDGFQSLKKKIKDEMLETETTEDAVAACLNALEGQPAEQVLAATVEVLAEAIDALQGAEEPELEPEEVVEEE